MPTCRICDSSTARPFIAGTLRQPLATDDLRITDRRYGLTAPLVRCAACGFVFADPPLTEDLTALYADLEDPDYVAGHDYRAQQMDRLLDRAIAARRRPVRTLLDIGAGSGLLVQAAARKGIEAVGVEPSRYLAEQAAQRKIDVRAGVWPHPDLAGQTFDLVTVVDVIEHVTDPLALLRAASTALAPDGHMLVTTPDPDSFARRLLGARWWHFRPAHVCFLALPTLEQALKRSALELVHRERQTWVFSVGYLVERVGRLLGGEALARAVAPIGANAVLQRLTFPLDLEDSWVVLAARAAP